MRVRSTLNRRLVFQAGRRQSVAACQTLVIFSLLLSLITPLAPVAAAQPGFPLPPPLPAPNRVALSGSFQTTLGCPADFDPTCPQTQLQNNRDGSFSAVLPVPAGDYTFRVVASSDQDRSLGTGGDPNGTDLTLSVPGNAAGAYFAYDSLNGEITATPVASLVTLSTDLGEQLAMAPKRQGGYRATWDAQPGTYGFQILVNGQAFTQDTISLDAPSRVIVEVDDAGAVTTKDTLRDTTLDVSAVDATGAPRTGSCFALIDRQGELQAQACDADDTLPDGTVRLRVPNGLDDGTYTLRETLTGAGAQGAADQDVQLGPGQFQATAAASGASTGQEAGQQATEAPTAEQPAVTQPVVQPGQQPGQLIVIPVDGAGNALPGACFAVVEFGFQACDDDGDGTII